MAFGNDMNKMINGCGLQRNHFVQKTFKKKEVNSALKVT
jgi:hypothetical protein